MTYLFAGWWVCGLCGARLATGRVQDLLHRLAQSVDSLLERPAEVTSLLLCTMLPTVRLQVSEIESLLSRFLRVLPPSNCLLTRLQFQLCGLYGRAEGFRLPDLR